MSVRRRKIAARVERYRTKSRLMADLQRFGLGLETAIKVVQEARAQGIGELTPELTARLLQAVHAQTAAEAG